MELTKENVGVIGQGFVGTAVREKFKVEYNVFAYDKYISSDSRIYSGESISDNECSILDIVKECNIVFVCVPTPMFQDGKCDISIVDSVINELNEECVNLNSKLTVIIKSTVPPGTTANLNRKYSNVGIVFSPEFLTEANANEDFENQTRIVLGVDWIEYVEPVGQLFAKVFPEAKLIYVNSIEAEMTKYFTNLFLATKVSFFNDMYKLCKRLNRSESTNVDINYNNVIEATLHDERIGKTHTMVPGPDGDYGYGGHCFPKDMAAILNIADSEGISMPTLFGAHTTNQLVRKNRDWEEMKGRAVVDYVAEDIEASNKVEIEDENII